MIKCKLCEYVFQRGQTYTVIGDNTFCAECAANLDCCGLEKL